MKIQGNHFDPTIIGMQYAISFVHYRYKRMLGKDALSYGAQQLRRIADEMDRIRKEQEKKEAAA
jgi:hypothetical protein